MHSNIYDVAERAGVSISTVSRVINNKGRVKKETEERILEAISELNFHPNMNATGLAWQTTSTIGSLIFGFDDVSIPNYFAIEFLNGVQQVLQNENYNLLIINNTKIDSDEDKPDYLKIVQGKRIDGLIIYSRKATGEHIRGIIDSGFPTVIVGEIINDTYFCNVGYSFYDYFNAAFNYLRSYNHEKIGIVYYESDEYENKNKISIMQRHFDAAGISFNKEEIVLNGAFDVFDIINKVEVLVRENKCTAFFTDSVYYAQQVIDACHRIGKRIPEDVSLVCMEYAEDEGNWLHPAVTGVHVNSIEIGISCTKLLFEILKSGKRNVENIVFKPQIKERGSVITL